MKEPTKEYLKDCFIYQNDDGVLLWKTRPDNHFVNSAYAKSWNTRYAGKIAGCLSNGYKVASVNKRLFLIHRLIWVLHYGAIPSNQEIDHINHMKGDNRINNLRLVTHAENQKNLSLLKNNTSGISGVYNDKRNGHWIARINSQDRKAKHLGIFKNKNDAIAARKQAECEYGYHSNHGMTV
ncbi:HNH endonuclease [Xenorhabdus sp. 18]|uniref:HNH endonuclease signature motif containing protein n=1 Tax=Xenorhabdus doucetiae TaxID=351671 RepID=UPI0019A963A1|nr:HNH endonuclease signature motif containing protein [Xenorhabdus sp. 18]MBD2798150.1 HNH endonuclease [Xenorhabdus sp. 18]